MIHPMAVRMRPTSLDELIGQDHLTVPGSALRRLVEDDASTSIFLWGPPGVGKSTIAHIVARATSRHFVELSAVNATIKEVRDAIGTAHKELDENDTGTVLFIDEIHRFSKTQQDALLPAVENRIVTLIAATTENPSFSVISPLLSRSILLTLRPLDQTAIDQLITNALVDERGLDNKLLIHQDARADLVRMAGGDARRALTYLEEAASTAKSLQVSGITPEILNQAVDRAVARYDRDGDQHYDIISAFIKSLRGSDPDAALHWLARMIDAGEDPRFIARRLVVHASEDVGMADPMALVVATAAAQAVQLIGLPEARINLAQATIHIATAPKSPGVIAAINAAQHDVQHGNTGTVPAHLRDANYPGAKQHGHGIGYRYPHHYPGGTVLQSYAPEGLIHPLDYYHPTNNGHEVNVEIAMLRTRLQQLENEIGVSS